VGFPLAHPAQCSIRRHEACGGRDRRADRQRGTRFAIIVYSISMPIITVSLARPQEAAADGEEAAGQAQGAVRISAPAPQQQAQQQQYYGGYYGQQQQSVFQPGARYAGYYGPRGGYAASVTPAGQRAPNFYWQGPGGNLNIQAQYQGPDKKWYQPGVRDYQVRRRVLQPAYERPTCSRR